MANQIEITSVYRDSSWEVSCKVAESSEEDFPREIFLWTLDDKGALDKFQAIGQLDQVSRYPLYNPSRTSNFGIHLVRYDSGMKTVSSEEDRDKLIITLKSAFDRLTKGFDESSVPVVELYPEGESSV